MSIKVNSRELYNNNIVCSEKLTVRSTRWNKSPYNIMRWCDLVAQRLHSWTRDMRVNLWRVRIPSIPFKNEICSYIIFFRTRKSARKFCIPVSLPLVNTKEILIMRSGNVRRHATARECHHLRTMLSDRCGRLDIPKEKDINI